MDELKKKLNDKHPHGPDSEAQIEQLEADLAEAQGNLSIQNDNVSARLAAITRMR